ncbi:sensor histidine kinase [Azospirillum sp. ST 5-10]|uniref:sensor histidine kinase n=1 Tax=unclassified Azospirillum TaxID=2630922 RepID=UPI003F49F9A8
MSLQTRVLLAMVALITCMVVVNIVVLRETVLPGYRRLELEEADRAVRRVVEALHGDVVALGRAAGDYASWDDTYRFIADPAADAQYAAELTPTTLGNLNVTAMYFFGVDGRLVWGRAIDPDSLETVPLPRLDHAGQPLGPVMALRPPSDGADGIVVTDAGPMIFAARPILTSEGTGPSRGTVIFGHVVGPDVVTALRERLGGEIDLRPVPAGGEAAAGVRTDEASITATAVMEDVHGRPGLEVEVIVPRTIAALGERSLWAGVLSLLAVAAADMVLMWFLLRFLVLRPIGRLTEGVLAVSSSADLSRRVPEPDGAARGGELGLLAIEFNRMMDRLERMVATAEAARDDALRASRAKSDFLATMSHELRTPLNSIIGFSQMIRDAELAPLDGRYRDFASDVNDAGRHLLRVINDVLDMARAEADRIVLNEGETDLGAAVIACLRILYPAARQAQVTLDADLPEALPRILADDVRMRQILMNLVANAVKFTPAGGRVVVRVRPADDGGVRVEVEDTGVGIAPEDIPKALEPFGQIDSGRWRLSQGTGLGLPLAKHLAEAHGGGLAVSSRVGLGTCVTVSLPAGRVLAVLPVRANGERA